jgi:DNA repair exonuclease SbcCD ATPase subunit
MKITSFEAENVKRIKAVSIEPTPSGLTVIGGNNNQGKTSVLDAIAWALGGEKYRPSNAEREGSVLPPKIRIEMDNGLIVERSGKNASLKVIDPTGRRGGQQLLNEFVEQLALDLPKFMELSEKEKALKLLEIIGVGDKLFELDRQEQTLYNERHYLGQIKDQKIKYARELEYFPDAPAELISITDLIKEQQDILAQNGENQRKRREKEKYEAQLNVLLKDMQILREKLEALEKLLDDTEEDYKIACMAVEDLTDLSTERIEEAITNIEITNAQIRANLDRERAEEEAHKYKEDYDALTDKIESVRQERLDLLKNAKLPLEGLSIQDSKLTYNGKFWDSMSGSEQLIVAASIVRKLNPNCEFVLMDKLEQMDLQTLAEFGRWLETEGLQVIATRVSTGDECSIIIEDGYVVNDNKSVWEV